MFFFQVLAVSIGVAQPSVEVDIPEVQELVLAVYALSLQDCPEYHSIDTTTHYYQQTMQWFKAATDEEWVRRFGRKMKRKFYHFRMDACNYQMSANGQITAAQQPSHLSWGRKDVLKKYIPKLEEWGLENGFWGFYQSQRKYFDSLLWIANTDMAYQRQLNWLVQRGSFYPRNVRVFFSPYSRGRHCTHQYEHDGCIDIAVFTSAPYTSVIAEDKQLYTILYQRMFFTEFDHHWVRTETFRLSSEVRRVFWPISDWAAAEVRRYYRTSLDVFDEYMTWALFLLFVKDEYGTGIFEKVSERVYIQMQNRGFFRFREFSDAMFMADANKKRSIRYLSTAMLDWCVRDGRRSPRVHT